MVGLITEKEAKNDINRLIVEELTVSEEVLSASKEVEEYILNNIQKQESDAFTNGGGKRKLSFSLNFFNDGIKAYFNVTNYNFINQSYYNSYRKKYNTNTTCTSSYNKSGRRVIVICWVTYISLDFKPLPKFYEDLHHELNHIYQQYKEGETYPDSDKYARISTDIYSENEVRRDVATLLYLCTPYEQDSFVSSAYSYVRHRSLTNIEGNTIDKYLKETEAFENICKLKELYNKIEHDRDKYSETILKQHGFERWDRFDKRVKNAIHRFEAKFAMCVKKCKKDFLLFEENTWIENRNNVNLYELW